MVGDIFVIIMSKGNRATSGIIHIITHQCKKCGHTRAWRKPSMISCSKCGHEIRD